MSGRRQLMIADAALPYTRVDYLQNVKDVVQYIDTGIEFDPAENLCIAATVADISSGRSIVCSSFYGVYNDCFGLEFGGTSNSAAYKPRIYTIAGPRNQAASVFGDAVADGVATGITASYNNSASTVTLAYSGKTFTASVPRGSSTDPGYGPLRVFCDYRTNNSAMLNPIRLYALSIARGGTPVRNFIPVLDGNGVPCLYDKISGTFFRNGGNGTLLYG